MASIALWKAGSALCASGIISASFGSHALKARLGDKIASWTIASQFLMLNGVACLVISNHPKHSKVAGPVIAAGTAIFSGSIIGLLLNNRLRFLGPVTPLGGLLMIGGYAYMAIS